MNHHKRPIGNVADLSDKRHNKVGFMGSYTKYPDNKDIKDLVLIFFNFPFGYSENR